MNHLGDTNKMVDTPRTDAVWELFTTNTTLPHDVEFSTLARQLERELNEANESFRKLNIHTLNLVDRIRRLEEAGDEAICPLEYATRVRIWTKAKEDKL